MAICGQATPLLVTSCSLLPAVIPEGLSQVVEGMTSGSVRLAVLPPELAYGTKTVDMPGEAAAASSFMRACI
jgi:FKBP-type peptidyl-prolyl cis-trans isomerase